MRIFAYPWDLADEGIERTLDRFGQWGIDAIAVAVNYHTAKLYLPHNPRRKVYFPEAGKFYFPLWTERFRQAPIQPANSEWSQMHADFWVSLYTAAAQRGIALVAWTIGLHNTAAGYAYPQYAMRNAFGDPYYFSLCPSHTPVADYLTSVVEQIDAFAGFREIFLESFQFMDFAHGYHHEMTGIALPDYAQSLLSLCFCPACMASAALHNIDAEQLRSDVAQVLETLAENGTADDGEEAVRRIGSQLEQYIAFRQSVVTGLIRRIRQSTRKPLVFFGSPPEAAQWNGVDYRALAPWVDRVEGYCYEPGIDSMYRTIEAYGTAVDKQRLRLSLRAGWPDNASPAELLTRIEAANRAAIGGVSLYNYGQVPLSYWRMLE